MNEITEREYFENYYKANNTTRWHCGHFNTEEIAYDCFLEGIATQTGEQDLKIMREKNSYYCFSGKTTHDPYDWCGFVNITSEEKEKLLEILKKVKEGCCTPHSTWACATSCPVCCAGDLLEALKEFGETNDKKN